MRSVPCKPARWPRLLRLVVLLVPLAGCAEGKLGVVAESTSAAPQPATADAHGAGMELASFQTGQSAAAAIFPALFAKAAKSHGIDLTGDLAGVNSAATEVADAPRQLLFAKGYLSTSAGTMTTSVVDIYDANHQILTHIEDQQNATPALDQASLAALADKTANDVAAFLAQHLNEAAPTLPAPAAATKTQPLTTAATRLPGSSQKLALETALAKSQ